MTSPTRVVEAYRLLLRTLPEPAILVDSEGVMTAVNPAFVRLAGEGEEALEGRSLFDLADVPAEQLRRYLARCERTRELVPGTLVLRSAEGKDESYRMEGAVLTPWSEEQPATIFVRFRPKEASTRRFLVLNRKIEELSGEVRERMRVEEELRRMQVELEQRVTERTEELRRANEDLQRSNDALRHFAFIAAHDLQEPLRKIQTFGTLLRQLYDDADDEAGMILGRMEAAAGRMQRLVRNLLDYSVLSARSASFERVDLSEVVVNVRTDLDVRIRDTNARVEIAGLPVLEADPDQMHRLFLNLLSNALKFHEPGVPPAVFVGGTPISDAEEPMVRIVVRDEGIGFEGPGERLFDLFHRQHSVARYEGSGLGLAICRRIVEAHRGTIRAEGAPGAGSTFTIELPLHQRRRTAP